MFSVKLWCTCFIRLLTQSEFVHIFLYHRGLRLDPAKFKYIAVIFHLNKRNSNLEWISTVFSGIHFSQSCFIRLLTQSEFVYIFLYHRGLRRDPAKFKYIAVSFHLNKRNSNLEWISTVFSGISKSASPNSERCLKASLFLQ